MARKAPRQYGKLLKTRWGETKWTDLSPDAQWLYGYLVSHPTTDTAGIFPIRISKWVKAAKGVANGNPMTEARAKAAAKELTITGWIVVDHDTEEGMLRTYISDDWAGDNIFKGALGRALLCQSPCLRAALLYEIRNLGRDFKDDQLELIDELESSIPAGFDFSSVGPPTPSPTSTATTQPFERGSDAVVTPLERRPRQCDCGKGPVAPGKDKCSVCVGKGILDAKGQA